MERLSIGDLANATGLTVRALRHYQDLGLLAPAGVHPATRYRTYGPEQLERAQAIARLRRLGLPLDRIRDYLAAAPVDRRGCSRTTGRTGRPAPLHRSAPAGAEQADRARPRAPQPRVRRGRPGRGVARLLVRRR